MDSAKIAGQIRRMEEALASSEVRKSAEVMATILHPDFTEIGASGTLFNLTSITELLSTEDDFTPYAIEDFSVTELRPGCALATYRIPPRPAANTGNNTKKPGSLRSSLWIKESGTWQLRFHQGTFYT